MDKPKRPVGNPTKFDQAKAEEICELIAKGETLNQATKKIGVPRGTFMHWVIDDRGGIAAHYARCRDLGFDVQHDMLFEVCADRSRDKSPVAVARDRLIVDTMKWSLSKMKPERYGESIKVDQRTTLVSVKDTPEELIEEKTDWATKHSPDTQH